MSNGANPSDSNLDPENSCSNPERESAFRLAQPTRDICDSGGDTPQTGHSGSPVLAVESSYVDVQFRAMGWRGIAAEPETSSDPDLQFPGRTESRPEMDMTSMVDVTFLLLIFFMVTASFIGQRAIEQPTATADVPGPVYDLPDEDDYV